MKGVNGYEYYINYPEKNESLDNDFNFNEKKAPLIIIFGWSGSVHRHLGIYSNMYNQKGLVTFSCICPPDIIFFRQSKMLKIVENMMENLENLQASERSVFIHLFSNGGSVQYDFLRRAAEGKFKIKGMIFDSAPGKTTLQNTTGALQSIYGSRFGIFSTPLTSLMGFLLYSVCVLKKICHKFNKNVYVMEQLDNLIDEKNVCPQHFIYSRTDHLIPYTDVDYFMAHRKSLGVEVSSIFYENTSHVRHYPDNKLTYARSVFNFIKKCLRK